MVPNKHNKNEEFKLPNCFVFCFFFCLLQWKIVYAAMEDSFPFNIKKVKIQQKHMIID